MAHPSIVQQHSARFYSIPPLLLSPIVLSNSITCFFHHAPRSDSTSYSTCTDADMLVLLDVTPTQVSHASKPRPSLPHPSWPPLLLLHPFLTTTSLSVTILMAMLFSYTKTFKHFYAHIGLPMYDRLLVHKYMIIFLSMSPSCYLL